MKRMVHSITLLYLIDPWLGVSYDLYLSCMCMYGCTLYAAKFNHSPDVLANIKKETESILSEALQQRGVLEVCYAGCWMNCTDRMHTPQGQTGLKDDHFTTKMKSLEQERQQRVQVLLSTHPPPPSHTHTLGIDHHLKQVCDNCQAFFWQVHTVHKCIFLVAMEALCEC